MKTLVHEFRSAMDGLDDISRRWLEAQGIRPGILEVMPTGPVTVARIETTEAPACFDFSETGERAFVHPVWDGGDIADLMAWRPSDPAKFWTAEYSGLPLGFDDLITAESLCLPLTIRRTQLSWLRAGGDGVVITSWAKSAPRLRSCPVLIAEDVHHGLEIKTRLNIVGDVPEIRVMRREAA